MGFSNIGSSIIGQVSNPASIIRRLDIPTTTIVLGSGAIGAFVGTKIGGPFGTAVGALVGSHIGTQAVGQIKSLKVSVNGYGSVEIQYQYA